MPRAPSSQSAEEDSCSDNCSWASAPSQAVPALGIQQGARAPWSPPSKGSVSSMEARWDQLSDSCPLSSSSRKPS